MLSSRLFSAGRVAAVLAALNFAARLSGAAPISAENLLRESEYLDVAISHDGKCLAFVSSVGDKDGIHSTYFSDLDTGAMNKVETPYNYGFADESKAVMWLNSSRALLMTGRPYHGIYGAMAVDRDGSHRVPLLGIYRSGSIDLDGIFYIYSDGTDRLLVQQSSVDFQDHPLIVEVESHFGHQGIIADDNEGANGWVADRDGAVRIGLKDDGASGSAIYRENDNAPWVSLPEFSYQGDSGRIPLAFDSDGHTVYACDLTPAGTWGVRTYDLRTRRFGPFVLSDPTYDIINPKSANNRTSFYFSLKKKKLIGIHYVTDFPRTVWLDPEMAQLQAMFDRAVPGRVNSIVDWSDDETKLIVGSWSDRNPTTYYLLDRGKRQLRKLFDSAPWINPAQLSHMLPLSYQSRDGLIIHGYVTFPAGSNGKNLPTVVLCKSVAWERDMIGFNEFVQYLAGRGYAVLQINYRGSPGYGEAFTEKGYRHAGDTVQNDITDGVRWAERAGIADPARVAIMGFDFGGYCAEWGLSREPALYRCGVSYSGMIDWMASLTNHYWNQWSSDRSKLFWKRQIGDPKTDEAILRDMSPINHVDSIRAPLFLIHEKEDFMVPVAQAQQLADELKARGRTCELWVRSTGVDTFYTLKSDVELYDRIGAFLDKNMK